MPISPDQRPPHTVDLRGYVDQRLADLDQRLSEQRLDLKERLATMNEFREALRDQANQMATRDQLEQLRERVNETRIHVASYAAAIATLISLVIALLANVIQ